MIVTCPSCTTKFKVSLDDLLPEGRTVRCGECHFSWFQSPEDALPASNNDDPTDDVHEDQPSSELDESFDEVLEQMRARAEADADAPPAAPIKPTSAQRNYEQEQINAVAKKWARRAAVVLFITILGSLFLFKSAIIQSMPATNVVYATFGLGLHTEIQSEDLAFERFEAQQSAHQILLSGMLYNLRSEDLVLPPFILTLKDSHENILAETQMTLPIATLPKEGSYELSERVDIEAPPAASLTVRLASPFDLMEKERDSTMGTDNGHSDTNGHTSETEESPAPSSHTDNHNAHH